MMAMEGGRWMCDWRLSFWLLFWDAEPRNEAGQALIVMVLDIAPEVQDARYKCAAI